MLTSSTQHQNRPRRRKDETGWEMSKRENARVKRAKLLFTLLNIQICDVLGDVIVALIGSFSNDDGAGKKNVT